MTLRINLTAPDFKAETTQGPIEFHNWEMGQRSCLITTHKLGVADDVGHEDGGEAALSHSGRPARRIAANNRSWFDVRR